MKVVEKLVPELRFSGFAEPYTIKRIDALLERCSNAIAVKETEEYQQIGIRSHGKGIFHKAHVTGTDLGNKRVFWVEENAFVLNIVFAWEQAVAKTSNAEKGMIASHRFPMYSPVKGLTDIDYILYFFLTKKGKHLLGIASPGGAGRNKTLGQKTFADLKMIVPTLPEQQKIASFLSAVDKKIEKLTRKKELLETYKKGVMQKLFSRKIRFKDENGKNYPDWEESRLKNIAKINMGQAPNSKSYTDNANDTILIQGNADLYNGKVKPRIYTTELTKLSQEGDIILTVRAPVGEVALSDYTSCIGRGVCSISAHLFIYHFLVFANIFKLWRKYSQGSTFEAIGSKDIQNFKIKIPTKEEQKKIANFLSTIDKKIQAVQTQLTQTQKFKKGLLQKMFV